MVFLGRSHRRVAKTVAGFLLALFWLELTHVFITPDLIPSWFTRVEAAVDEIVPNGDGSLTGTVNRVTCAGTARFECLDDTERDPTAPGTGGDYLNFTTNGATLNLAMTSIAGVDTVSAITVKVYHEDNPSNANTNMRLTVSLWNSAGTVQYGSSVQLTNKTAPVWSSVDFTSLSLSQADLDGLQVRLNCGRASGPVDMCRVFSMYANVTYNPAVNLTVGSTGSQVDLDAGATNEYIGGAFVFTSLLGSRSVTSITISETGTVHAQNNIKNVKLFYNLDTSSPYNCASESFSTSTTQFGSTVTGGFNAANGTATFSDSVTITTTQTMCVYVVLDVQSTAALGETLLVEITNPTSNVGASAGSIISPATPVALPGTTTIRKGQTTQTGYHWRIDNGSEITASSATNGVENTIYEDFPKGDDARIRLAIANTGTALSTAQQFRLEFAVRVTNCSAATGWTDVGVGGGAFDMSNTLNLTDGDNTTNIASSTGGITDPPSKSFIGTNAGVRDTSSQTGNITLTSSQFVELEYSIIADPGLTEGAAYCFRVTNAGTPLDFYSHYPQLVIAADVRVSSIGTLPATVSIPQTNYYVGGAFVIREITSSRNVTSITVTHTGTADGEEDLSNIKLFYELDITSPYDCVSEGYPGSAVQFGSTVSSFDAPQGTATFSDSVPITLTQTMCVYVMVNISGDATTNDTIAFSLAGGGSDVGISSGTIAPLSSVSLSGSTALQGSEITQYAYHWRNNDGSESGATSMTGGTANTARTDYSKEDPIRLRIGLNNTSSINAPSRVYRLEYGVRVTTCDNVGVWQPVSATSDWMPYASTELTHNGNTTDISVATGGISDIGGKSFVGTNGVRTTEAQTASVAILTTNYYEFEFSLRSSTTIQFSTTYCFRLARASGTALEFYTHYPTLTTVPRRDFRVQRGSVDVSGTSLTVNAGVTYTAPKSNSTAFVRITGVSQSGSGPNQNSIDTSAAITFSDIRTSFNIVRPTGATGSTRVTWELIEFIADPGTDNEMIVRDTRALTFTAGNTTLNGSTIAVSSSSKVVVFITGIHSSDAGRDNYYEQQVTSEWDSANSRPVFRRGASSVATLLVSYAVVEYTGINWKVQRIQHTYTAAGSVETENITQPLNSVARAFTHVQKRMGAYNTVQSFGHRAWINSIGQASFELQSGATTPGGHTTVMWIIENFQTSEGRMRTQHQQGSTSGGTAPLNISVNMPSTINTAVQNTSIFATARAADSGNNRNYPRPLAGFYINSLTTYQVWRGDTGSELFYGVQLVEWPTHGLAIRQNYYRVYVDNGALTPSDPWPLGVSDLGENTSVTANDDPPGPGGRVRLRMALRTDNANWPQNLHQFKLQYGVRTTTCSAISSWTDVGAQASGSIWRLYNVSGPSNGTALSSDPPSGGDLLLSVSTVAGVLAEAQPTAPNPYNAVANDNVEFDWALEHNGAASETTYCFRMIFSTNDPIDGYLQYPQIRTAGYTPAVSSWRWYDDTNIETPVTPLASENVAPIDIGHGLTLALRVTISEIKNVSGSNVKFAIQYDESPLFTNPRTVTSIASCQINSEWCYTTANASDNATIQNRVLTYSDTCASGTGAGCGRHNTSATYVTGETHTALTNREYAFYLQAASPRTGAIYYFRLLELNNNRPAILTSTSTNPSLVAESASLTFSIDGLPAGTLTSNVVTTATTSDSGINFDSLPPNEIQYAAHRLTLTTNATEGYRVLKFARSLLENEYGVEISSVTGTNSNPTTWDVGCSSEMPGCVGYHTSDATLSGNNPSRFLVDDSYAGLSINPVEIMYSPVLTTEIHDIVYAVRVNFFQPIGTYNTDLVYIAIPTH